MPMIECGNLSIDLKTRDIRYKNGTRAKLTPKAVQLMLFLAERPNQLISREEIFAHVWEKRFVEENALDQAIFQARLALGDHARTILVSVPKRGVELKIQDGKAALQIEAIAIARESVPADVAQTSVQLSPEKDQANPFEQPLSALQVVQSKAAHAPAALIAAPSKANRASGWLVLASALFTISVLLLLLFLQHRQPANLAAVKPKIVIQAGMPDSLVAAIHALSQSPLAKFHVQDGGPVGMHDIAIGLAGNARGVLVVKDQESQFYEPPEVRALLLREFFEATDALAQTDAPAGDAPLLPQLMQSPAPQASGKPPMLIFPSVNQALLQEITADPFNARPWNELSILVALAGNADAAVMLADPDTASLKSAVPANPVKVFADDLRNAKNLSEGAAVVKTLRAICARTEIGRYSWVSGACALELGLAELNVGDDEAAAMTFAYAHAAFARNGDGTSQALITSVENIAFLNPTQLTDLEFSKVMALSDLRAFALLLRPLVLQKPKVAFQIAEAALRSPAIGADYAATTSIAAALGLAARRSHDPALKKTAVQLLDNLLERVPKGELQLTISQSVIYLRFATGEIAQASTLIDQYPDVPEPQTFRCVRGNVLISALRLKEALADFQHCHDRRRAKPHASLGLGLSAASDIAATLRLMGNQQGAQSALADARAEFNESAGTELNWQIAAANMLREHIHNGQIKWVLDYCQRSNNGIKHEPCELESLKKLITAEMQPELLKPSPNKPDLDNPDDRGYPLILNLYFEQKRTGKCSVAAPEMDAFVLSTLKRGQLLLHRVLTSIREDCAAGRAAEELRRWPLG